MIWDVRTQPDLFEGWTSDSWEPRDLDPVLRIFASPRKVGQVLWHPTASNLLASASGDHLVKFWDLNAGVESPRTTLTGHTDGIQSIAFNPSGTLLVTSCRDKKLRLFDPRAGGAPVREGDGHTGIKASRVVWLGDHDRIATTGFSKMSDRQLCLWDANTLTNLKTTVIDQSAGVLMPFWSDNNILFLAGKGDGNIRFYEYDRADNDSVHLLSEHRASDPQRGMAFLPRRALSVGDCEIARAVKVHGSAVEPIAFIVPRKADSFQSDIFPPAPSVEATLSAAEFFAGKEVKRKVVDLSNGTTSSSSAAAAAPTPASASTQTPTSAPAQSPASSSPAPVAAPTPAASKSFSLPPAASSPVDTYIGTPIQDPQPSRLAEPAASAPAGLPTSNQDSAELQSLRVENARLNDELREARALIREMEVKVERNAANARRAALMLSEFE
ncbi:hypothetical protein BDV98DRAFT_566901 [Pterulicium gracile]|uniref:Coronin n=1 Tax=Pterulicium gracile TaxID=1884261 RepID=A0A5C3QM20_9AGAR|nr:hypothetical protein BDV98DRAFT_566901 [Pterula gracilis]